MRKTILTTAMVAMISGPAMAFDAKTLIAQETHLDDLCRGTDNNNACIERQKLLYRLTGLGWCFGKNDQATYKYRWHRCGPGSNRSTVEDLHSYDSLESLK